MVFRLPVQGCTCLPACLPASITILDQAAASLKRWGEVKIKFWGHTGNASSEAHNLRLISKGIAAPSLTAMEFGELCPVAGNDTREARCKNFRAELVRKQETYSKR